MSKKEQAKNEEYGMTHKADYQKACVASGRRNLVTVIRYPADMNVAVEGVSALGGSWVALVGDDEADRIMKNANPECPHNRHAREVVRLQKALGRMALEMDLLKRVLREERIQLPWEEQFDDEGYAELIKERDTTPPKSQILV